MSIVARGFGLPGDSIVAAGLGLSAPTEKTILIGDGYLDQPVALLSGVGYVAAKAKPAAGGGGGNFGGRAPHPLQLVADIRREKALDAIGFRLVGDGVLEQGAAVVSGAARIKRIALVATSATVDTGSGEAGQTVAEFVDVELELAAIALALAA